MVDRYRNWAPRDLSLPTESVSTLRAHILEETMRQFRPDVFVADFMPAGPYGELLPALEELGRQGGRAIAGFRDVIDEPEFVRRLWSETGVYDTLRRFYSDICVYGDRAMVDFADAYDLDETLAARLHYCGYLGRPTPTEPYQPSGRPFIVATSGGGVDGAEGLKQFIEAAALLGTRHGQRWLAVTGPLMPDADHRDLAAPGDRAGVAVHRVHPDLRRAIAAADCVVAMAGYNTVCDILSFQRRAVLTPRSGPSQEQRLRAARLEQWGVAHLLSEGRDGDRLAAAITSAMAATPATAPVPLGGIQAALDVFDATTARQAAA